MRCNDAANPSYHVQRGGPAVETVLAILDDHPGWVGATLFAVVFVESLIVVGYLVPAGTILLAAGTLIGTGHLDLAPAIAGGAAGAFLGSAANYWLGARFQPVIPRLWPFRRHPKLLARNKRFVQEHGGKSIILARFTKPLRPAIPAVAGLLEMPRGHFLLYNLLAATTWVPAYLAVGITIGTSTRFEETTPAYAGTVLLIITIGGWLAYAQLIRRFRRRRRPIDSDAAA